MENLISWILKKNYILPIPMNDIVEKMKNIVGEWPKDLLALIPVYNHGNEVGAVIDGVISLGANVLVVNDGSTDDSGVVADKSDAITIHHKKNQGKAAALLTGMLWATEKGYKRVLTIDADGQHPIEEVPFMVKASNENEKDIIIGRRDMSVAPKLNRFGRFCSNFGIWWATFKWVGDSQSGLRVYPVPEVPLLPSMANRYAYEVEVLVRASWAKIGILYIPVKVLYPETRVTHFRIGGDSLTTFSACIKLLFKRFIPWRKNFLPELPSFPDE